MFPWQGHALKLAQNWQEGFQRKKRRARCAVTWAEAQGFGAELSASSPPDGDYS